MTHNIKFLVFDIVRFLIMWLLVRLAPLGARQKNTRYAGARRMLYPKNSERDTIKGVQANCKAKGEEYGLKGSFVLFLFRLTIFLYFFFLSLWKSQVFPTFSQYWNNIFPELQ